MSTKNDFGDLFEIPTSLQERCIRTFGWSNEFAKKALKGYRQFIKLKLQQEDWDASVLSPSNTVDKVWHQHILDVTHYIEACEEYAGRLIGHNPEGSLDVKAREDRIKATKLSLKALFGRSAIDEQVWDFEGNDEKSATGQRRVTREPAGDSDYVTFTIRNYREQQESFVYWKRTMKLGDLFERYASFMQVCGSSMRFLFDGHRIEPGESPSMIGLDNGGQILMMLEQRGC